MVADLVGERRRAVGRREWLTGLGRTGHAAEQLLLCAVQQRGHMIRAKTQLACDVVTRQLLEHSEPHDARSSGAGAGAFSRPADGLFEAIET